MVAECYQYDGRISLFFLPLLLLLEEADSFVYSYLFTSIETLVDCGISYGCASRGS
jgi:hypothetical protein